MLRTLAGVITNFFSARKTEDTNSSDSVTSVATPSNPLDDFNQKLELDKKSLDAISIAWQDSLEKLIRDDASHQAHQHLTQCDLDKTMHVTSVFSEFKNTVKKCFTSPGVNLQEQLNKEVGVDGHIKKLELHIEDLCGKVHAEPAEDERRGIKIHICHASLAAISELKLLSDGFAEEIWFSLTVEQREEEAIKLGFNLLLAILCGFVGLAAQSINFDGHERFKRIFNATIVNQENDYGVAVAEAKGVLDHAQRVVSGDIDYVGVLRRSGGSVSVSSELNKEDIVETEVDVNAQRCTL